MRRRVGCGESTAARALRRKHGGEKRTAARALWQEDCGESTVARADCGDRTAARALRRAARALWQEEDCGESTAARGLASRTAVCKDCGERGVALDDLPAPAVEALIAPQGSAVLFHGGVTHAGNEVRSGVRHLLVQSFTLHKPGSHHCGESTAAQGLRERREQICAVRQKEDCDERTAVRGLRRENCCERARLSGVEEERSATASPTIKERFLDSWQIFLLCARSKFFISK